MTDHIFEEFLTSHPHFFRRTCKICKYVQIYKSYKGDNSDVVPEFNSCEDYMVSGILEE